MQKSIIIAILAAIAGGICAQSMPNAPTYTYKKRALYLFCGAISAFYVGPYAIYKLHLSDPSEIAVIYFAIGALWNSLFEKAITFVKNFNIPFGSK